MGEEPVEDCIDAPMTPEDRQYLFDELLKLAPEIRGYDPHLLVELINDAVTQPLTDEEEFARHHGEGEFTRFRATRDEVREAAAELVKAANILEKFITPEVGDSRRGEYEQRYPWFDTVDSCEAMIAERFAGRGLADWEHGQRVAAAVRRAVQELGLIEVPPLKRGTRESFDFSDLIVRAACFYRATQNLPPVLSWGELENAGDKEKGRWREKPLPQTDVARLIVAVAIGTNHMASNAHLRGCLNKYRELLNEKKRGPALWDFC